MVPLNIHNQSRLNRTLPEKRTPNPHAPAGLRKPEKAFFFSFVRRLGSGRQYPWDRLESSRDSLRARVRVGRRRFARRPLSADAAVARTTIGFFPSSHLCEFCEVV
ncbi:hypothetical protein L596_011986 [Steinernema carpocapsae]|uniref:Uncharacterized protein n=1 Tax=Steinernema carpocapsae TaxID=34508 RepID=A0A4U5NWK6_STECR|nr:hypothetical protein L596_011986 [Steinernema carpocapsae]